MKELPRILILLAAALGWMIGYTPCIPFLGLILFRTGCARTLPFSGAVVLTGLVLYPTALGFTSFDLYQYGWGIALPIFVALIATILLYRNYAAGLFFSAALLAAALRIYPSTNLWDYLIDPIFFLYCVVHLFLRRNRIQPSPYSTATAPSLP